MKSLLRIVTLALCLLVGPAVAQNIIGGGVYGDAKVAGGASWNPNTDTGMVVWWRADSVTTSGSNIVSMIDKSGNGNTGAPVGTAPTLNSSCINSQPCIVTVGSSNNRIEAQITLATQTSFSFGLIYIQGAYSSYPRAFSYQANGQQDFNGTNSTSFFACDAGGGCGGNLMAFNGGIASGLPSCSPSVSASVKVLYVSNGTTLSLYCNGTLAGSTSLTNGIGDGAFNIIALAGNHADANLAGSYADWFLTKTVVSTTDFNTYVSGRYAF